MSNNGKTIGGISIASLIAFGVYTCNKQNRMDEYRNEGMLKRYELQERMKSDKKRLSEFEDIIDSAKCEINTKDINIDGRVAVFYPCDWENNKDESDPKAKSYFHSIGELDNSGVGVTVNIEDVKRKMTPELIRAISTVEIQQKTCENDGGYFISTTKIKVGNLSGNEVIFRKQVDNETFAFYIANYIYHDHFLTSIIYTAGSTTQKEASMVFERYKPKFRKWFKKTKLL